MDLRKLAILSYRYPKIILLFWAAFLIYFGFSAAKLPSVLKDHGLTPNGSYLEVEQILSKAFRIPEDPVILVFEKKASVSPGQFRYAIQQTLLSLGNIDGLSEMISPLEREGMRKGNFAYALLAFNQKPHEMKPVLAFIQKRLPNDGNIVAAMTGKSVVQADVNEASQRDFSKAERIGIPVAFLILWIAFGGMIPALIPIVIGMIGVTGTMGFMYMVGSRIELSNFVLNVIPMVGLALSIDFALLLVSRFREELQRGPALQALIRTMETAGRAVVFSALSIFLGLAGILFIPLPMFSTVALGAMAVLSVSVLLTLTLVPALLGALWPAMQPRRRPLSPYRRGNRWYSLSSSVMQRPLRMLLLASFVLIGCLLPLSRMSVTVPDATSLPSSYSSRMAFEVYQSHFHPRTHAAVYLAVQGKSWELKKADWMNAYALTLNLSADPQVRQVESVFSSLRLPPAQLYAQYRDAGFNARYGSIASQFVKDNRMLIQVTLQGEPSSKEVRSWLRHWEQEGKASLLPFMLGGEAKYQQEVFDDIFLNIKFVLLFIFVSNYVVLFVAFRSVLIPFKTIVMNLLSIGASFGILVWIFAEGHAGMEPSSIAIMIPVFIFGLVFGISMDYGVFLVSRIHEVYQQTQDNSHAVLAGLASISRIINSAAAIIIAVTLPFAFGEVAGVKQLGVGIAAAIFIDATIIRMIVVPSLMRMFGKWNWWAPSWLK
ncbi:efflux RND transporter permease subunit [Paenibacillus sp. R14(2021)]|uniref:MMPL family transporter n=1 Tax=Paenibacillus sp. R14(2021) TaxID=2859228 RepID=UPI001C614352|nr:efflux RND transporter permease subunit [Paenibacillus sp. R14(2021)]